MTNATEEKTWIPHPGEILRDELEARGWSQRDLAFIVGCAEQSINVIVSGKRGISADMAKKFADAFDVPAEFFANLQQQYDLSRASEPDPSVGKRRLLQSHYPIREMIRRQWLQDSDVNLLSAQLAKFFEVNSLDEVPYLQHAAKKTRYELDAVLPAQLAWLFRVRQIAQTLITPIKYTQKLLKAAVERLTLLRRDAEEIRHVPRILAESGVRFVCVESLPGSKIDGVCFWLDDTSPVIGMSLQFDRIDNFWFVLRHEIEHVLNGDGKEKEIIDSELSLPSGTSKKRLPREEVRANAAAATFCVDSEEMEGFIVRKNPFFSEPDVTNFAERIGVHPGLVVGQLHARFERYDILRKFLAKVRHIVLPNAAHDGWGTVAPVEL